MKLKFFKKKLILITAIFIALIGIILSYFISPSYPFVKLQNYLIDFYYKINKKISLNIKEFEDNIIIATINEDSLTNFVENKYIKWPWHRKLYAGISHYLLNKGAKAVVLNINFTEPDIDHHGIPGYGKINDNIFFNIIYNSKKVIIPFGIDLYNDSDKELNTLKIKNIEKYKNIKTYKSLISPYSLYTFQNKNFGFYNIENGTDNKIRNYLPFVKINNNNYPSLAVATYLLLNNNELPKSLSLNKDGTFILNKYYGRDTNKLFNQISFYEIFSDYLNELSGIQPKISEKTFKDKIFFIGTTSKLLNMQNSHIISREIYPHVEIHALAYQNLINKDWIKNFSDYYELPFYFILIFLLIFLGIKIKSKLLNLILYLFIIVSLYFSNFLIFIYYNIISNNFIFITLFIILSFLILQVFKFNKKEDKKNKFKKTISSYFNVNLVRKTVNTDKKLLTEAKNITTSILVIEIDNFQEYIKNNESEKIFETLNIYFNKFSDVIINNKGFIYKILENEIIVLFGAPIVFDDHADMAVKTAFDCYNINKDLLKAYGLNIKMGISSGNITIGGLDVSDQKFEYIAFGNCINVSRKLKNLNRNFNTDILVGKDVKKILKNVYTLDYLGEFLLDKNNSLYEIYYFTEAVKQHKERFKLMANAYENNDINSFKRFISYFLEKNAEFGPALFYIKHHKNNENNFGEPIKLISEN